ncbi:MAG: hypothetical protein ABSD68_03175 [Candidatus Micrarchaeales archaeon]
MLDDLMEKAKKMDNAPIDKSREGLEIAKRMDKALITGGTLCTLMGIREILEPTLRRGVEIMLPKLTNIAGGNLGIDAGIITAGTVAVTAGIGGLAQIKLYMRSEKNRKPNDAKNISEKDKK